MLTQGDLNVVSNIRGELGEKVMQYSDEHIAKTWIEFSLSNDYPDMEKFIDWLSGDF